FSPTTREQIMAHMNQSEHILLQNHYLCKLSINEKYPGEIQ
ncbi:unnamed protein product, partial [Allacma fusca]